MPRRKTAVKIKSLGVVDIHFHGAFGIDLMTADHTALDDLAARLGARGVAAFCATTLSVPYSQLTQSVRRLGQWITHRSKHPIRGSAACLGIHLEGPYIHPGACGAHPPQAIRKLDLNELEELWQLSHHQLKILTIAPEQLSTPTLTRLNAWARAHRVTLSLGHSRATHAQASQAFDHHGFTSVTHAWNAMPFHQREPGVMGAALGRPDVAIELILDQVHVSPEVMRWTRRLHDNLCYVSDCVPAAATRPQTWHRFGQLRVQLHQGAARLKNGSLAGGGILLVDAFATWISAQARHSDRPVARVLRDELDAVTLAPLRAIGLERQARKLLRVEWRVQGQKLLAPKNV